MSDTPETDKLIASCMTIGTDAIGMTSKLTLKCMDLERERDEARSRFNEIDLCQNAQAPCKWSLTLIADCDAVIAERDRLITAIEIHRAKAFPLTGEDFDQELWSEIETTQPK